MSASADNKMNEPVDYFQAMRAFDKDQGRKPDDFDLPLKSSEVPGGGVDYLAVSREWAKYLDRDRSEVIRDEKQ